MKNRKTKQTETALLDELLQQSVRQEAQVSVELTRAKLLMTRSGYDTRRNQRQKDRDARRFEKLLAKLAAASDRRQQLEALILARGQAEQGVGLIETALARKTEAS